MTAEQNIVRFNIPTIRKVSLRTKTRNARYHRSRLMARYAAASYVQSALKHAQIDRRELAVRLDVTPEYIAKVENATTDVSLDFLYRVDLATGYKLT